MAMEERKLLESWKEISAYLNRSVRTCRRFEAALGLPVHRLDGTPRARVFAYADELDDWLQKKLNHVAEEAGKAEDGDGRKRKLAVFAVVVSVALAAGAAALIWRPFSPAPGPILPRNPTLAVLPFDNPTADAGLEPWRTALADLVVTDLVQSRYVNVVRIPDLARQLVELRLGEVEKFSEEAVRAVAAKAAADYVTTGRLAREGRDIAITILVLDPRAPEKARTLKAGYRGENGVFAAVDGLTREIKLALGLTRPHVSRDIDRDVADISTDSPQAFRLCSQGCQLSGAGRYAESIPMLQRAIDLDPEFALAYKYLYRACQNAGRPDEERTYVERAVELSGRLSARERYETLRLYYQYYREDMSKSIEALERLRRHYPQDRWVSYNLFDLYFGLEDWDRALAVAEGAWAMDKAEPPIALALVKCYQNLGWEEKADKLLKGFDDANPGIRSRPFQITRWIWLFTQMKDFDKALAEAGRLAALSTPDAPPPLLVKGTVLMLKEDFPAALEEYRKVLELDDSPAQIDALLHMGDLFLMQGRIEEAKSACRRGLEIAGTLDGKEATARFNEIASLHQELSYLHQLTGRFEEALTEIEEALRICVESTKKDPPLDFLLRKGLILLDMDNMEEFERVTAMVQELAGRWKKPRLMRVYHHLRGRRALKDNDPPKAVNHFWKAVDLLSVPGGGDHGPGPDYFFYLAEALRLSRSGPAFPMYEKVTLPTVNRIHRGDLYAMSFYRMAKYLEELSDARGTLESFKSARAGAIENYRRFLALWGGADPIFAPLVEDARCRLAALEKR